MARRRLQKDAKRSRITGEEDGPQPHKSQRKLSEDPTTASEAEASSYVDPLFANSFHSLAQHGYTTDEAGKIEHISPERVRALIVKGKVTTYPGYVLLFAHSDRKSLSPALIVSGSSLAQSQSMGRS